MHYRHGDLLIVKVSEIPAGTKIVKNKVLAEGENTGHSHRVSGAQVLTLDEDIYIQAKGKAAVIHEEHAKIELPPGDYRVIRQKEYDPYEKASRLVAD